MRSSIEVKNKLTLVAQMGNEAKFQILKYSSLKGASELKSALAIKNIENTGQKLKQIRIVLNDAAVKIQDNLLSYMKGYIERNDIIHEYKGIKKMIFDSKHRTIPENKTIFKGNGEILLKPEFNDFTLIELVDEEIIINDKIFCACDEEINIDLVSKSNNEEIKLSGSGIVALMLPVPEGEIIRCKLFNDKLTVNDELIILKSKKVKVSYEKYEKIINDEIIEEINVVYEGIGEVWLLPTRSIYEKYGKINCSFIQEDEDYKETDEKI